MKKKMPSRRKRPERKDARSLLRRIDTLYRASTGSKNAVGAGTWFAAIAGVPRGNFYRWLHLPTQKKIPPLVIALVASLERERVLGDLVDELRVLSLEISTIEEVVSVG